MSELSPEALAFFEEEEKNQKSFNNIRLNPSLLRMVGKDPNNPNPDKMGRFFIRNYDQELKTYPKQQDEIVFGQGQFSAVILDITYKAQWKYVKGAAERRTREFHKWNEPIELLEITRGDKPKTDSIGTFTDSKHFKATFRPVIMGIESSSPYDWHALVYVYHPATDKLIKYDVKGTGIFGREDDKGKQKGGLWEYLNESKKAFPNVLPMKILTKFGIEKEEKDGALTGFTATFEHGGIAEPSMLEGVARNAKLLREWQDQWKKNLERNETDQPAEGEEMPTIDAEADLKQPMNDGEAFDAMKAQKEKERAELEVALSDVPF